MVLQVWGSRIGRTIDAIALGVSERIVCSEGWELWPPNVSDDDEVQ